MGREFQFGSPEKAKTIPRILTAKLVYTNPKIKVHDWHNYHEGLPFDYELVYPENVRAAKYKAFGDGKTMTDYITTTRAMTEQIWLNVTQYQDVNSARPKVGYYTYSHKIDGVLKLEKVSRITAPEYLSVMKSDYIAPKYIINYGLKYKVDDPAIFKPKQIMGNENSKNKFIDDGMVSNMHRIQELKRKLYRSYNIATGKYTDEEDCRQNEKKAEY